jgi:SHOCT-like domain
MSNEQERIQILEMIEKGVISAEEGVRLLNSLQGEPGEESTPQPKSSTTTATGNPPTPEVVVETATTSAKAASAPFEFDESIKKWRRWWWIPLAIGIVITVASGSLMYLAYLRRGLGFWFACLWFPLLLGVLVISLAAASRTTRWMHVRVHQEPGEWPKTIAISMPLPIRFIAWILRTFKPHIPNMDKTSLDEVILALDKTSPEQPFYVKVDEGESGEKVEVYIG